MIERPIAGTAPLSRLVPAYIAVGLNKLRAVQADLLLKLTSEVPALSLIHI